MIVELDQWLTNDGQADIITMSGSGEPTLNSEIGQVIGWLKQNTKLPVAVLTNGSLLWQGQVREDLSEADLLIPSLDSATEPGFRRVNRPASGLSLQSVVDGVTACRREFDGRLWLEVVLVAGINDTDDELDALRDALARISPDCVQLNTVVRPPAAPEARRASPDDLQRAAAFLGAEIVAPLPEGYDDSACHQAREEDLVRLLRRRPCTLTDLVRGLAIHLNEASKFVQALLDRGEIESRQREGGSYFAWRADPEEPDTD